MGVKSKQAEDVEKLGFGDSSMSNSISMMSREKV
jgi:hypothetical protein